MSASALLSGIRKPAGSRAPQASRLSSPLAWQGAKELATGCSATAVVAAVGDVATIEEGAIALLVYWMALATCRGIIEYVALTKQQSYQQYLELRAQWVLENTQPVLDEQPAGACAEWRGEPTHA
eukprot:2865177-Prymnesium_polylepis.1